MQVSDCSDSPGSQGWIEKQRKQGIVDFEKLQRLSIYFFKYLLSVRYVAGSVLGAAGTAVNSKTWPLLSRSSRSR